MNDKDFEAIQRFLNQSSPAQMLGTTQPQPAFSFSTDSTTPDLDVDKLNDVLNNMRNRIIALEKSQSRLENQLRGAGGSGWRRAWGWLKSVLG